MIKSFISLGFSCQTRFSLDVSCADPRRMPFDFNITTLQGLVAALESNGETLIHSTGNAVVFTAPKTGRQGISQSGIFFWHDYPLMTDNKTLAADWQKKLPLIQQKYQAIWTRFSALLRSRHVSKTLLVSNSQSNLGNFVTSGREFDDEFGLNGKSYEKILAALQSFEARNFDIVFLNRNLPEVIKTRTEIKDPKFRTRFFGVLPLPTNPKLSALLLAASPELDSSIADLCGNYDGGRSISRSGDNTADISQTSDGLDRAIGEISAIPGGYIAVFEGLNNVVTAFFNDTALMFSNKTRWIKID